MFVARAGAVSTTEQDAGAGRRTIVAGLELTSGSAAVTGTWIPVVALLAEFAQTIAARRKLETVVRLRALPAHFYRARPVTAVAVRGVVVVAAFSTFPDAIATLGAGDHEAAAIR